MQNIRIEKGNMYYNWSN